MCSCVTCFYPQLKLELDVTDCSMPLERVTLGNHLIGAFVSAFINCLYSVNLIVLGVN